MPSIKSNLTKLIKLVLFLVGLWLLIGLLNRVGLEEIAKTISGAKIHLLIFGLLVYLLLILIRALKWFLLIRSAGNINIKYGEFLPFYLVNSLMGNITPLRSGETITPFLLKKYLKIPAGQGFSIVALDRFFELTIFSAILLATIYYLINAGINSGLVLSIFKWIPVGFFFLMASFLAIIFAKKIVLKIIGKMKSNLLIGKASGSLEKELQIFYSSLIVLKNIKIYKFMLPLTLISWILELLAFYLIFSSVLPAFLLHIAAAQVISMAAALLSFIPGGIGLAETGVVYIMNLFNYPVILSASGVMLVRLVLTGTLMATGIIGIISLKRKRT